MSFFKSAGNLLRLYAEPIIVAAILVLGFILRLVYLDSNDLALDEPFSVFHAQLSVKDILESLKGLNNPPLNELILHFWIKLFGMSVFSVRFPALIFGTVNLLLIYLVARKMFDIRVAMLALILVVFSNYQLFFSHEARVYSLFALLTTWSFYLLVKIIKNESRILDFVWLYLCYTLLIFAHYFGLAVILMQVLFLFVVGSVDRRSRTGYLITIAAVLATYSFYLPEVVSRFLESSGKGTWLLPVENLGNLHDLIFLFANSSRLVYLICILTIWGAAWKFFYQKEMNTYLKWGLIVGLVPLFLIISYSIFFKLPFIWRLTSNKLVIYSFPLVILIGYGVYLLLHRKNYSANLILLGWFIGPLLIFFLVSFKMPIFLERYLVFIMPAFYIMLAVSIAYLLPGKFFWAGAAGLVLVMLVSFNADESNRREVKKLAGDARILREDHAKILICPGQFIYTFSYHFDESIFRDHRNLDARLEEEKIYFVYDSLQVNELLTPQDSMILYIDARGQFLFPRNGIVEWLTRTYGPGYVYMYEDSLFLHKFRKRN
ncbi:MAG: glycosyltransferase family 39 protein [Bacteroidales bacterium]|nr:glycosyltransferase family 39 protein [Bacteroidales bacterium]